MKESKTTLAQGKLEKLLMTELDIFLESLCSLSAFFLLWFLSISPNSGTVFPWQGPSRHMHILWQYEFCSDLYCILKMVLDLWDKNHTNKTGNSLIINCISRQQVLPLLCHSTTYILLCRGWLVYVEEW